ncbi:MAG: hypothetical protein K2Q13_12190 [Nitrosomonas sp.]|uniref:hypothetical protein n=1 Tax=Nitrosomonas sp. TaxID=42353 RepID=UPI0025EAE3D7|nr:hypothetical protein [Nitrosomonas sp.]MBY0475801.1 hypothetical protein [Nitrosomonas sp.]
MNEYKKYLVLKSALESIFGKAAWYALKESNHVPTWRKYGIKTLQIIKLAIEATVEIADEEWRQEINNLISDGIASLKTDQEIDEIISTLAGTLIQISFHQIGLMPNCRGSAKPSVLKKGLWRLNLFRSVVYLQTQSQKEQLFLSNQRKEIGFDAQLGLQDKYRKSKTELSFSEWCKNEDNPRKAEAESVPPNGNVPPV